MIRTVKLLALALTLAALATAAQARPDEKPTDDKKEVTLKGDICCAKCELKKTDKCATVIRVKEDGKEVVYYFDKEADKKYHKPICMEVKEGTVVGKVTEKDGKKTITVTKLDWKK